jgi:ubiquitin-protein ligase
MIVRPQFLFQEPTVVKPLNEPAAQQMRESPQAFKLKVEQYINEFAQGD